MCKFKVKLIAALLVSLASSHILASGFQLLEQNAGGIGNAYAGSAASAKNANTVFYNPAGMTQFAGTNTSVGITAIGGAQSLMFEIKTLNINPSIAYRASETVSLGFGLNWQKLDAKHKRIAGVAVLFPGVVDLTKATSLMGISGDA